MSKTAKKSVNLSRNGTRDSRISITGAWVCVHAGKVVTKSNYCTSFPAWEGNVGFIVRIWERPSGDGKRPHLVNTVLPWFSVCAIKNNEDVLLLWPRDNMLYIWLSFHIIKKAGRPGYTQGVIKLDLHMLLYIIVSCKSAGRWFYGYIWRNFL